MAVRLKCITLGFLGAASLAGAASAAIPGPQRMIAPGFFGFEEIAERVYAPPSMTWRQRDSAIEMLDRSRKNIEHFYGWSAPKPWVVLCPASTCDQLFGKKTARGTAYGSHLIRLNDKGINEVIATHEFAHIALKARVGDVRTFFGAVPVWFDEGLATFLSGDDRYAKSYPREVLDDLRNGGSWWYWGDLIKRNGWKAAYGGSKQLVRELHDKIGNKGLRSIVDRLAEGETFESVLSDYEEQT